MKGLHLTKNIIAEVLHQMNFRLYQFITCFFFIIFSTNDLKAQSADRFRYYILYDISGSMPRIDSNGNAKVLLERMVKANFANKTVKTDLSFELVFFGEPSDSVTVVSYNRYDPSQTKREEILVNKFNTMDSLAGEQDFTHLQAALDWVKKDAKRNETIGIFILTDGRLEVGDVDSVEFEHSTYVEEIAGDIQALQLDNKPVFVVQTSDLIPNNQQRHNRYFDITEDLALEKDSSRFLKGGNFFWVNNKINLKDPSNADLLKKYDEFLLDANYSIIEANQPLSIKINSATEPIVPKALMYSELLALTKLIKRRDENLSSFNNHLEALDSLEYTVNSDLVLKAFEELEEDLFEHENLNKNQISEIGNSIEKVLTEENLTMINTSLYSYFDSIKIAKEGASSLKEIAVIHTALTTFEKSTNLKKLDEKDQSRDLEEAIVLGLADYLIKRTQEEAFFIMYENLNDRVFKPSPYIKDTLFFHVSSLIRSNGFEPNLVLLKQAFQKDVELFPQNLIIHPKVRESDGLLALTYSYYLIDQLTKRVTLEDAFIKLSNVIPDSTKGTTNLERGLLFTSKFIGFLKDNDLTTLYRELESKPKELERVTRIIAIWFANRYPDILRINSLSTISDKIKEIFASYALLREQMIDLEKQIANLNPTSDYQGFTEYKKTLVVDILTKCTELMISGLSVIENYSDFEDLSTIRSKIFLYRQLAKSSVEAWFLIQDGKYAKGVSLLLPMIPLLPPFTIQELSEESFAKVSEVKSQLNLASIERDYNKLKAYKKLDSLLALTFDDRPTALQFLTENRLSFLAPLIKDLSNGFKLNIDSAELINSYETVFNYKGKDLRLRKIDKIKKGLKSDSLNNDIVILFLSYLDYSHFNNGFKKLIAAAGEVSTATTAGDVEKALSKYSLPVASYRIKRTEPTSWMINAYTGAGGTVFVNEDSSRVKAVLSAPIGVEYSRKIKHMSLSIFGSLLDVGNIINYRINEDRAANVEDDRSFKIENIVSPGLFIALGVSKRFPFSILAGYQFNPQRFTVTAAFDLPLFRLK